MPVSSSHSGLVPAAAWLRVSTGEQEAGNQEPAIEQFASHHGYRIAVRYRLDGESAYAADSPEYRKALTAALDAAWRGEFKVIIVWALDRITRLGAEDALRLIRQFRERGVTLVSVQEPWLNSSPQIVDVLVAFAGWQAQMESQRRSERIKAGIAKRKAAGQSFGGRKPGSKDKKPRDPAAYKAAAARRSAAKAA